jgi:phospholipid transport system substrate-binding protein
LAAAAVAAIVAPVMPWHSAGAQAARDAGAFVASLAQEALDQLTPNSIPEAQRAERFRELMQRGFDAQLISRFVLGRYWRQATEAERAEYVKLFDQLVVQTYSRRLTEFSGARIKVNTVSPPNEDGDSMVGAEGQMGSKPPVRFDIRVRKQADGGYRIIDVMIEGVSMAITQRDEFASVIQRGGGKIEALLANLREKVAQR